MSDTGSNPFAEPDFSALHPSDAEDEDYNEDEDREDEFDDEIDDAEDRDESDDLEEARPTCRRKVPGATAEPGLTRTPAIAWQAGQPVPCSSTSPAPSSTIPRVWPVEVSETSQRHPPCSSRCPGRHGTDHRPPGPHGAGIAHSGASRRPPGTTRRHRSTSST